MFKLMSECLHRAHKLIDSIKRIHTRFKEDWKTAFFTSTNEDAVRKIIYLLFSLKFTSEELDHVSKLFNSTKRIQTIFKEDWKATFSTTTS